MGSGLLIALAYQLSAQSGPVDQALRATESPDTLRAAFTIRLVSDDAMREFRFDPRLDVSERWQLVASRGRDDDLDETALEWSQEPAPDGRLFPDDLRPSVGARVDVSDLGAAWRVRFRHHPSLNDTELDAWFAERVDAEAWLDPQSGRFMRLDYELPHPVRGPKGGRLTAFEQSYLLESDPNWGFSYVASYSLSMTAKGGFRTIERHYTATVTSIEIFFANPQAEADYEARRQSASGRGLAAR
ncbi:MAG: hypothetical protein RIB03_01835 [Henriciella sp.]|uniref:hypothetical protein n=1 Tax=Henriciella sp. TaxID=1968823 RepID=UPI0032ED203C